MSTWQTEVGVPDGNPNNSVHPVSQCTHSMHLCEIKCFWILMPAVSHPFFVDHHSYPSPFLLLFTNLQFTPDSVVALWAPACKRLWLGGKAGGLKSLIAVLPVQYSRAQGQDVLISEDLCCWTWETGPTVLQEMELREIPAGVRVWSIRMMFQMTTGLYLNKCKFFCAWTNVDFWTQKNKTYPKNKLYCSLRSKN